MKERELKEIILEAANDLKGQSINCIDVRRLTSIADYMVIVTGRSSTHVKALSDNVVKEVKNANFEVFLQFLIVCSRASSSWIPDS